MIKPISQAQLDRVRRRLRFLYGERANWLVDRFYHLIGRYGVGMEPPATSARRWDQKDVLLITYADMVHTKGETPLKTLHGFALEHLKGAVSTVHILPFYPWSSDDGFSVIDYRQVKREYGTWSDVEKLGEDFNLAFDLVLNHCSAKSAWFQDFILGISPARHYFLEMDPKTDLSAVVRPRTSPLLTKTTTRFGESHVWTTFSADQVDLNWQNSDLLFEFLDILLFYISKGVRTLRLDAVAFAWKEIGTDCLHRPQTHEIVKLLRDVCEIVDPQVNILTETNVPHAENISYFGEGDEAHVVYNFSLPPLLLHALLTDNCDYLYDWLSNLEYPEGACTYLNFTASHDGIGVRPLQGLLPDKEFDKLIKAVEKRGAHVSRKANPDGSQSPYELNITYASALSEADDAKLGTARFLCSQYFALSLKGIPAVYFHSLMATPNYDEGVEKTGAPRSINRRKWDLDELEEVLDAKKAPQADTFRQYVQVLRRRANYPAFNPDGSQELYRLGESVLVLVRTSTLGNQTVYCVFNFSSEPQTVTRPADFAPLKDTKKFYDVISAKTLSNGKRGITLKPYQAMWLVPRA
ncbi:alpha-amylase family glycosyl hydrolase [Ruficoccus sp. ZRK36]|uniref:alpha-amylase family glycosyl hydrolase n=1 Tax=Ruficoccus sp. ZRK36 TaxID=2866311 RepID=UPI001C72E14C|nr:alpha-amylase family glycosyl hydrolase [Ruficoccus sp. ZRK36]QYY35906.1 hypothetical protein K0V07_00185 [Ruficoccus sp. ZRK36]